MSERREGEGTPSTDETLEWVAQYHFKVSEEGAEDFCSNCGAKWPCALARFGAEVVELRAQVARSMALATERGRLLSECARLIPIARPLPDRIRFVLAERDRLVESLECLVHRCEAEGCGTSWAPITDAKNLLKEIK